MQFKTLISGLNKNKDNLINILEDYEQYLAFNDLNFHEIEKLEKSLRYNGSSIDNKLMSMAMLMHPSLDVPDATTLWKTIDILSDDELSTNDDINNYLDYTRIRYMDYSLLNRITDNLYNFMYYWQDRNPDISMLKSIKTFWDHSLHELTNKLEDIEENSLNDEIKEDRIQNFVSITASTLLLISFLLNGKFQDLPNKKHIMDSGKNFIKFISESPLFNRIEEFNDEDIVDIYSIDGYTIKIEWSSGMIMNIIKI